MLEVVKTLNFSSTLFNLKLRQTKRATVIDMQLNIPLVNTSDIPDTFSFLQSNYPSVLDTQCFNDNNLPFSVEVTATEIGHLFEHILIDELCSLKIKTGAKSAVYSGNTSWNWKLNPYGSFQIWIDIGKNDLPMLLEALKTTIDLTQQLIQPGIDIQNLRATSIVTRESFNELFSEQLR